MILLLIFLFSNSYSASTDIDAGYFAYLSSDMYIESIRSELMPENCYLILLRKFQESFGDEVFEHALNHIWCDDPALLADRPWVDTGYHPAVPVVDFLSTPETMMLLKTVNDRAHAFGAEWPRGHQSTNLAAYHLTSVLSQRSVCETLDCRVFRKIIEQFHFRLSFILNKAAKPPEKFDFIFPISVLVLARQNMETHLLASLPRPPKQFGLTDRITQSDCWSCLFGRSPSRSSSVVAPLLDNWGSLRDKQMEYGIEALISTAENQLDSVGLYIRSIMDERPSITSVHNEVIRPLMALARGVSFTNYASEMDRTFRFLFHLVNFAKQAAELDQNAWQQNLHYALDCVSQLRYIIHQIGAV